MELCSLLAFTAALATAHASTTTASQNTASVDIVTDCTSTQTTFTYDNTAIANAYCTCANGMIAGLQTSTIDGTPTTMCPTQTGGAITTPAVVATSCASIDATPAVSCTCNDNISGSIIYTTPQYGFGMAGCAVTTPTPTTVFFPTPTATLGIFAGKGYSSGGNPKDVSWYAVDWNQYSNGTTTAACRPIDPTGVGNTFILALNPTEDHKLSNWLKKQLLLAYNEWKKPIPPNPPNWTDFNAWGRTCSVTWESLAGEDKYMLSCRAGSKAICDPIDHTRFPGTACEGKAEAYTARWWPMFACPVWEGM